ncbi:MAG: septum formation inhibitor Maf [Gammaproteobacteria bacterium]|nr:septum formation inhibitor Maf [Gammaproteobacteria bacterium]NND39154.1 septum formation inhibitor Maf [Pseudomonadales bacterium]MBT8152029.1 septum formation inhibitor Maf [Gammaproteobacteria bacterium]NNL11080.1 septum formation inhibitor Maf [Pseudomonadales bacterium]NNM12543.1 septum formation inhibitor Maf [Pseudomonadales bacterium]
MTQLFLASASPRRAELLAQIAVPFERILPVFDEQRLADESPRDYVSRLASGKAEAGRRLLTVQSSTQPRCVLGADTIVVLGDTVFGKPANAADHHRMMKALSDSAHQVLTAVTLLCSVGEGSEQPWRQQKLLSSTEVRFKPLSDAEIQAYWASKEPRDKAGGYAIQGIGALFVASISGSYSGVVGLPLYETGQLLARAGVATPLSN